MTTVGVKGLINIINAVVFDWFICLTVYMSVHSLIVTQSSHHSLHVVFCSLTEMFSRRMVRPSMLLLRHYSVSAFLMLRTRASAVAFTWSSMTGEPIVTLIT